MVVVEPTPGRHSTVIVVHDPLHAFDVAINQSMHLLRIVVVNLQFALSWDRISIVRDGYTRSQTL